VRSANPSYSGQAVTFAIAVTGAGATPTGTVSLAQEAPPAGTDPFPQEASGTGTLDATDKTTITVTFAYRGNGTVHFNYSGDANYAPVTVATTQVVNSAFTITGGGTNQTITSSSGQPATAQLSLTGVAGYSNGVTLGCIDLPANISSTFSPATLIISGTTAQSSTLTLSASSSASALAQPRSTNRIRTLAYGLFAGSLLLFLPGGRRRSFRMTYWIALACLSLTLLPLGCGGNAAPSPKGNTIPAGTYPFYVTATAGMVQVKYNHTLVVQ
jgi:hypothetical protein